MASFAEWSNKKKKEREESQNASTLGKETSQGPSASKPASFGEWSNQKKGITYVYDGKHYATERDARQAMTAKQPVNKPASDKASAGTDLQQTSVQRPVTVNRPDSSNRYMSTEKRNALHQSVLEEAKAQEAEQARQAEAKAQAKLDAAKRVQAQRSGLNQRQALPAEKDTEESATLAHRTAGLRGPVDPEQAARNEAVRLAEDQALRDAYRETYGEDAPEKSVWNQIKLASAANLSGLTKAGQGLINTVDFAVNFIPRMLEDTGLVENATDNPVSNAMQKLVEMGQRDAETWDREVAKYSAAQGTTAGKIARFQEQVMQNVPQSVIAVMEALATGGASAAAALGAPVQGVLPMVREAVTELGKKPGFWYSFITELGNNYQEALDQGADNDRATVAALTASLANAAIEVGGDTGEGGLETLLQKIGGGQGAMVSWLLSLPEEGLEEVLQGITTRATNAAMFKEDTPLYGQGGVFDKEAAKDEFGSGMAVATVLGGAQIGANAIYNKVTADSVREQAMQQLFDTLLGEENQSAAPTHPVTETQESTAPDRATTQMRMNQVQESAAALGESGSRALTAAYDEGTAQDLSAEDAYAGFTAVYNAKLNGQSMTEQAQQAAAKLPEHMRMAAESAAENDSIRASQAKYFGENAGLDRKDAMTKRANLSSKTMRLLDAVGKAAGVQVRFAETVAGGMSNASYENGVVTIALDTESPVQAVFTHEIVHRIREVSPESYGQLAQFVTSNMHQMKLRFAQASYGARYEASGDMVTEEIVADAIGFVLSDSKMVNKLVQENRSLAQRIADGIHDFVAAINRVLEGQNVKLTSSQKFTFRELEGQLDEMGKLLGNALKTVEKTGSQAYNVSNETKFSRKESQYGREENRGNEEAGRETEHDARGEGTVQRAVRRVHGKEDGMVRHSQKGERPVISWKPGEIITPANGTVAYDEAQTAESYNVSCFVIQDAAWDAYWAGAKKIPPAFTKGGQVYLRATIPSDVRGMVAPHELTHVMKQTGYQPYLDFINRTLNHLNQKSAYTQQMLTDIADQRGIVLKPKMDRNDIVDWYDEFHANIYGEIAANTTDDVRWLLDQVFLDFDAYAAELTELHRQFKAIRTGAKLSSEALELSDVNTRYSLREKDPPKKTGVAYKVFYAKDGQLYPPMVANPGGAGTPVGVWLDADIGAAAAPSKTGRAQVQAGGKGTNASKGSLAFRPGWHLGDIPQAKQFARKNPETGKKDLFPADFVWAECEYAMDHDYQEEAMSYGYTENGKFRHSYAGLPKLPVDGYYRYRTNPNPDTVPWVITGAMKVTRILTDEETDALCRAAGVEPMKRQGGPIDLSKYGLKAGDTTQYSLKSGDEGATFEENGVKYSIKSLTYDITEGRMFDDLVTAKVFNQKEADLLKQNLDKLVSYMLPNANILDMNEEYGKGNRPYSAYKPNSDPLYVISLDFSTLCRKRLMTQYVIEQLQLRENRPMTAEEQIAIRSMLLDYRQQEQALQVACAMCYVEAARLKAPKQMERFFNDTEAIMRKYFAKKDKAFNDKVKEAQAKFKRDHGYDENATKKDMSGKDIKALNDMSAKMRKEYTPDAKQQAIIDKAKSLPRSTFLTAGNLTALAIDQPDIYAAYTDHIRASTRSKSLESDIPYYYGDSQGQVSDTFIDSVNAENGMRFDSWSDFQMKHMLDMITAVIDLSVRGSKMHGYTKFPEMVRIFGKTGMMFNLSGVTEGNGFDANGNLLFSNTEGIDIVEARKLLRDFPETAGLQCIGVSDDHVRALLRADYVDYVIPYHTSGMNATLRKMAGINAWKDYTSTQHARKDPKAKKPANADKWQVEPVWSEFYVPEGKNGLDIMRKTAQRYIDMCHERGLIPKFDQFMDEPGYWKLLVDRKMINQVTGEIVEQKPVKPIFDFDLIKQEIDREVSQYDPQLEKRALKYVVDNFDAVHQRIRDLKKGHPKKPMLKMANEILQAYAEGSKGPEPGKKYSKKGGKEIAEDIQRMVEQYGQIEAGEKPFREATLPKKTAPGKNVSQTVRTVLEAEATPEIILPDIYELASEGHYSFESITDKQAIQAADAKITDRGWAGALAEWTKTVAAGKVSKENTATGWALYNHAANAGDTKAALEILDNMVLHQRSAAQALQATRILKNLTPEAQLYNVTRSVKNLQEELDKRYGEKHGFKVEINENLAERFLQAQTDKTREEVLTEIYRDIGRQMPSRFMDKWNAWRYLAMLGNPRTHVRNIVGNAGFAPVVAAKNVTATGIESMVNFVSRGKTGRTKSIITGATAKDRALLGAAWADYAKAEELILAGGKYDDLQRQRKEIESGRVIFKTKPLEAARRFNSAAMEQEDSWFAKPHYAAAMAGYCKANGITPEQIAKDGAAVKKAREYAVKEAQKATYRDTNALSQVFSDIGGKWVRSENPAKKAVGHLVEGILPFRKTPANILARGLEYSPLGIIKGVSEAVRSVKSKEITPAQAIDSISAGLTGTGLLALGFWLASMGLVRGHGSDDEKERGFEELSGHQSYSMEIGNDSYTLDWLAPECLPFFVGVNLYDLNKGKEETNVSTVLNSMTTLTEPMLEMSCLQSLNDLIDSVGYASSNDLSGLVTIAASAATSYITQAFPTLLGQIERSGEAERMTSYTDKNNRYLTTDMQYTIGKVSAKLPGWDFSQIPYIDAWGRTESSGKVGTRVFNNMLNPSYTSTIVEGEMEEELLRLYMQTDDSVFPSRAAKYFNVDGERKDLTAEEYVKYATLKGQTSYEVVSELLKSKAYKGMNDEKKAKAVEDSYTLANQLAKSKISDYAPDSWVVKAMEAKKSYNIPYSTFVAVRAELSDLESLKDADGDTITNSLGLLKMEAIYNMKGLTDKQRQALFEYMGVGKNVIHYNPALVKQKLAVMRKKAQ